jgi:hypothetical protein
MSFFTYFGAKKKVKEELFSDSLPVYNMKSDKLRAVR